MELPWELYFVYLHISLALEGCHVVTLLAGILFWFPAAVRNVKKNVLQGGVVWWAVVGT